MELYTCTLCGHMGPEEEFSQSGTRVDGSPKCFWCKDCKAKRQREYNASRGKKLRASRHLNKAMWSAARLRAEQKELEFSITPNDIHIPHRCPIFGMELEVGGETKDNSPSLDRVDNDKGYVPGNVVVISWKANRVKSNATLNEMRQIVEFYEKA